MFGMVTEDTLYVRVDDHNRATFKRKPRLPPLNYVKGAASSTCLSGACPSA